MLKDELIELYTLDNTKYNFEIFKKLYEIRDMFDNIDFAFNNLDQLFDFERYVLFNKGANRFKVEERVLEFFQTFIIDLCETNDFEIKVLDELLVSDSKDNEMKKIHTINLSFLNFAKELFSISISRDSFSTKRKGYALGIISRLLNYYDISNKFDLFIEALRSPKDKLIIEALNELHYYHENIPEKDLSEKIVNELDKIMLKTKNRTVASGALNLQVITGRISEFAALSRIHVWKEKYYDY
jgi:hypothetical protein